MTTIITETAPLETSVEAPAAEVVIAEGEARVALEEIIQEGETARAEIAAEVASEQIEAAAKVATAVTREELDECRRNIETLTSELAATRSLMQSTLERLEELVEETEGPPSQSESPESVEAVPQDHQTAEPPKEPEKKKPAIRWT